MHNNRKSSIACWVIASLGAVSLFISHSAKASCSGPAGPVELLWSFPAEGQEDVPIDAQARLIFSAHLYDNGWKATLNDAPVTRDAEVFSFDRLEPNTSYTLRIEGHQPRSLTEQQFELHFRTGAQSTGELSAPDVLGTVKLEEVRDTEALCQRIDSVSYCRDTPPYDFRGIMLQAEGAIAWLDEANNALPLDCHPLVDVGPNAQPSRCFEVRAVAANGSISEPTEYCPADEARLVNPPQAQTASACAVAAPGQQAPGVSALAAIALGLALRLVRRRRAPAR